MISSPATGNSTRAIVFIDSRVPDVNALIAAVQPGVRVVLLDADANGVAQMASALEGEQGLASISIISHGSEGALHLGNGTLNADNLAQHQTALEALGAALQPGGDILLYGCDVAAGAQGQEFIAQLAQVTQADVAASTNRTGSASLGADWVLEARVGEVQNDLALNVADVGGYSHTLAPANQSFDAQAPWYRVQLPGSAGETIDGMIYSIGRAGNTPVLNDDISLGEFGTGISSLPGDQALRFLSHMFGSGSYASIKSADGAEFRMVSMEVENVSGGDLKFAGYRNGEEVATGQFDTSLALYTNESLSYVRNELQGGGYGTVNFASSWYNVDEIRISIPNFPVLQIAIDDLVFANAVLPGPQLVSTTFSQDAFKIGDTATVTFTFAGAVEGFELADITVPNGKLTNLDTSNGGITWTATLTPDAGVTDSSNVLTVDLAGVVGKSDQLAGVGSVDSPNFTIDTQRPEATLMELVDSQLANGETTTLNITFNEAVSGLTTGDLLVPGGNLSNLASNDGIHWTATFTPAAGVTQVGNKITLDLSGVTDSAGNAGQGTRDSNSYAVDTQSPTAEITIADTALTAGQTSLVTVAFSEAVTGFGNANLTAPNGTLSTLSSTDGDKTWTATFTPTAGFKDATNVMTLDYTGVKDLAGNPATGTTHSDNYTIDTQAPTATVVVADTALAAGETSLVTITFNEAVSGFDNASLTLGNGTLSTLESSDQGITWTAIFTPTAGVTSAENLITLNYNGIHSVASGNAATGSKDSNSYAIDTQRPGATIELDDSELAIGEAAQVSIVFTEAVTDFALEDLSAAHGELSGLMTSDNITWTATFTPTAAVTQGGNHITLNLAGVKDLAGNAGQDTVDSQAYAIDTAAPVFISAAVNGRTLVLSYAESGTLDGVNIPAAQDFDVRVGAAANAVTAVSVDAVAKTVTLTLATAIVHGNVVTLSYNDPSSENDSGAIQDAAGNDAASLVAATVTNNTPAPEPVVPPIPTQPPVVSVPVDGVPVITAPGSGGSTIITIPVVVSTRPDTPGTPSALADIPLVTGAGGRTLVLVSVPVGVGLQSEGLAGGVVGQAGLTELVLRVQQVAGNDAMLTQAAQVFHDAMSPNEALTVQIVKPTTSAGYDASVPLLITGSSNAADGKQAIVLDGRSLPKDTVVQLDNVDFAAIVGAVQITGGAGRNVVSGDGAAQYIVLGPEDDIIHGGGGNDTVGSKGGDDQLYGDAGDDIVFGGAGSDLLSGGSGSDRLNGGTGFDVALQEGKRSDYVIALDGAGVKLTHIASGVSDWLVDVEQVRFETGPILTVAHSAAEEAAAFLFQQWMGRDLTQSEGAVIQTLDGLSALEVADLFAQVFPAQAAGRTPAQLLEGLDGSGAIRVDAVRGQSFDAGDNTIAPAPGLAWSVDGGAGIDTVVFPASFANMHIEVSDTGYTLQRMTDGAMLELSNVERLALSDTQLALDLDGHAGQAAKLLGALGGTAFLTNKPLVGEAIRALDAGATGDSLAALGLQALGAQTALEVTQLLWTNVMGSAATPAQLQPFVDMMAQGVTGSELAVLASNLELNSTRIDLVGLAATGIEFA